MTDYDLSASYWNRQRACPSPYPMIVPVLSIDDDPYRNTSPPSSDDVVHVSDDVVHVSDDVVPVSANGCNDAMYLFLTRAFYITTFFVGAGTTILF